MTQEFQPIEPNVELTHQEVVLTPKAVANSAEAETEQTVSVDPSALDRFVAGVRQPRERTFDPEHPVISALARRTRK